MAEKDQRAFIVRNLRTLDAFAVENRVRPGTPDVNYAEGWIELKWIKRWPRNADISKVHVDHFVPAQRVWLKTRWRKGGRAFLLLQAGGQDWLLFDGYTASQVVGRVTREQLFKHALAYWHPFNKEGLIEWLTKEASSLQRLAQAKHITLPVDEPASPSDSTPSD